MKVDSKFRADNADAFISIPLKQWVERLDEILSEAHVQNVTTVDEYIKAFNQKNSEAVKERDMR